MSEYICENCGYEIKEDDQYCSNCGIFFEEVKCDSHPSSNSDGKCLVCGRNCCEDCGLLVNDYFLCNDHSSVEIIEGMARVYGSSDSAHIDYYVSILEQEGLHPFKYSRKASPISLGGLDYTLFRASGESNGELLNEIKILLPLKELLKGAEIIIDLNQADFHIE